MPKCIIWCRVSTDKQEFLTQQEDLIKVAKLDGFDEADMIVIGEAGASAIKMNELYQKEVNQLIDTIKNDNDITTTYVWEVSRLARNKIAFQTMQEFLITNKIQLICQHPSLKLLDENGEVNKGVELAFDLLITLAKQEMEIKSQRFAKGKRRLAEQGKYNGGAIPYGYRIDYDRDKLIVVDEYEASVVRDIFNMYEQGYSQMKIAKELYHRGIKGRAVRETNNFTLSLVHQILTNELLTGKPNLNKGSSYVRTYPQIITEAQFNRCRERAKTNNTTISKAHRIYYATGLIKCTECGRFFGSQGSKSNYHCRDAYNGNRQYEGYERPQCSNKIMISTNIMDSLLWELAIDLESTFILNSATEKLSDCQKAIASINEKIDAIPTLLGNIEARRDSLLEALAEGLKRATYERKKEALNNEQKEIEERRADYVEQINHLKKLEAEIKSSIELGEIIDEESADKFVEVSDAVRERVSAIEDDEERKRIIRKHISEVRIEWSSIYYKFKRYEKQVEAPAKRINIDFYINKPRVFYFVPFDGKGGKMLEEHNLSPGLDREMLKKYAYLIPSNRDDVYYSEFNMEYLNRVVDITKIRRRQKAKDNKAMQESKAIEIITKKGYISLPQLATTYGFAQCTIRSWLRQGLIKGEKVGGITYIHKDGFELFYKQTKPKPKTKRSHS